MVDERRPNYCMACDVDMVDQPAWDLVCVDEKACLTRRVATLERTVEHLCGYVKENCSQL